jgi:hypothetical protein
MGFGNVSAFLPLTIAGTSAGRTNLPVLDIADVLFQAFVADRRDLIQDAVCSVRCDEALYHR